MTTPKPENWAAEFIRIGNEAVREAQERNRRAGIPNWYSLNGRLVCDSPLPQASPEPAPPAGRTDPA